MGINGVSNGNLTPQMAESSNVSGTSTPRSTTGSAMIGHSITDPVELWRHADPESTQMHKFKSIVNFKYGLDLNHYEDLHKWSVDNIANFWSEVWDFVGIQGEKHYKESEVGHIPTSCQLLGRNRSWCSTNGESNRNGYITCFKMFQKMWPSM